MQKHSIKIFAALAAAVFVLSLFTGKYPIVPAELPDPTSMSCKVFFTLRLPRTVLALFAGCALALSGFVFQTLFSNPIAAPDIIGISSGASAGAAAMILFFGSNIALTAMGAAAGGFLAVGICIGLVKAAGSDRASAFLLAGIAVNALSQAALMVMKLLADPERQLASIEYWTMGSFSAVTKEEAWPVILLVLCGAIPLVLLSRVITILSLPEEEAKMLGVSSKKLRPAVILLATLVVTSVTGVTGLISFIGLLGPHIARLLRKRNDRGTMILSMLCGAVLVLASDCIARSFGTSELPISIVTSLLGAPYLIFLLIKGGAVGD